MKKCKTQRSQQDTNHSFLADKPATYATTATPCNIIMLAVDYGTIMSWHST